VAHPQIAVFARLAKGGEAPRRLIYGQPTLLSRTMHDIRYNELHDEIYVGNPFAQAILTFRGGTDGQQAPLRIIQGPKTLLGGVDTLEVDTVHDELLVPEGNQILVFPRAGNGDVAPLRIVKGGDKMGWRAGGGIAVDPVHNVLVTDGTVVGVGKDGYETPYERTRDTIFIFDRLANGEVKPLRRIRGPKTGIFGIRQIQVYPKNGWIVVSQITSGDIAEPEGTFVGVWSIYDNGDVPPRWRIDGKPSNIMKKPRGVALNPKHKEVLVSDMRLNAVLTFSFPEIYDQEAKPSQ
jgi:DNA-binding beta-propeller fold protein YncE